MKKFLLFIAASIISFNAFAATITANDIDFGTVSIKGETLPLEGSQVLTVNFSGFDDNDQDIYAEFTEGEYDETTNPNGFYISPYYVYKGYQKPSGQCSFTVYYSVKAAGTYTGKLHLYSDYYVETEVNISITVTNDAVVAKTAAFERINTTSGLKAGDTIVFVCESANAVGGPLNGTYLPAITENVSIDKAKGTADIPETAQMFVMSQYNGNWQFTAAGTTDRLLLDVSDKGAFAYGTPSTTLLAGWGISISGGTASIYRPSDETFPVYFNNDRFKPYKNSGSYSDISLYKKVGQAVALQSSLTIEPTTITMTEVEMQDTTSVLISYTTENLTEDIDWDIAGTDRLHFSVTATGDRESGTVKIKYLGTKTTTGAVSASLYYLTQDAQLDPMDGSFPINLTLKENTILLSGLAFDGAPTTIDKGQSIDMSQYIVFTPNDAEDKSLTWNTDHDYQGTITEAGVLTAKKVTGTVTVTATSVRVPSVSVSHTLTITEPTITDFTLSDSVITLYVGSKDTLSVTALVPTYASATPTYTSSNTAVATVKNGIITAVAIGDAEITATIGSIEKKCVVHVVATPVTSIAFDPTEIDLTLGNTLQLAATVLPAQAAADNSVAYVSGNESVVSVTTDGLAKALKEGTAVITATADGKSAELTIHVVAPVLFTKVFDPSVLKDKDTIIIL